MRTLLSRSLTLALLILAVGAAPSEAQGNWQPGDFGSLRFRLGLWEPEADSEYWDESFAVFTGSPGDFQDLSFGFDYLWRTSAHSGIQFGTSWYSGQATQSYWDYVDLDGYDISHGTELETWDINALYVFRYGDASSAVIPYAGLGAGLLFWSLEEAGDFIDFSTADREIYYADYYAEGWTWEALALVGIDVPLGFRWSFFGEGRYRYSEDELGDDFSGFGTLDLSGWEFAAGFAWNF